MINSVSIPSRAKKLRQHLLIILFSQSIGSQKLLTEHKRVFTLETFSSRYAETFLCRCQTQSLKRAILTAGKLRSAEFTVGPSFTHLENCSFSYILQMLIVIWTTQLDKYGRLHDNKRFDSKQSAIRLFHC